MIKSLVLIFATFLTSTAFAEPTSGDLIAYAKTIYMSCTSEQYSTETISFKYRIIPSRPEREKIYYIVSCPGGGPDGNRRSMLIENATLGLKAVPLASPSLDSGLNVIGWMGNLVVGNLAYNAGNGTLTMTAKGTASGDMSQVQIFELHTSLVVLRKVLVDITQDGLQNPVTVFESSTPLQ